MQFFRKILLFIAFCFAAAISVAQQIKSVSAPVSYRAIRWTVPDGLSAWLMHAMIKHSKGFLWLGSSNRGGELCRFDGATFKKYIPDPQKSVSYFSPALITQRHYNTIQRRDNFETVATRQNELSY